MYNYFFGHSFFKLGFVKINKFSIHSLPKIAKVLLFRGKYWEFEARPRQALSFKFYKPTRKI